jgi:mono/diheme cytochrome c family protein
MIRINIGLTLLLMGCGTSSGPPAESAPSLAAQEARTTFDTVCSTCHGPGGTGDGIGAANLNPKPRNYTDKAWQASVTDDQIKQIILGGGASVGKSPMMPPQPQLKDKPRVIDELVKIVRSFGNANATTSSR